ncbi:MAG: glycosyltransferase family 39 protein [Bdellovibrionaceae bacterium]|nr:glycosyltransferase family 39 protein [Pseudobdellovibrionaceae bacterium]
MYRRIFAFIVLIYLALFLGLWLANAPNDSIWMPDSIRTHVPVSKQFSQVIQGHLNLEETDLGRQGVSTHILTGTMFTLFGINIYSTLMALFIFKALTLIPIFLLAKELFDTKTAYISSLLYIFAPTLMFYSISFYKEMAVQFYMAWVYYSLYKLFYSSKSILFSVILLCSLMLLSRERFYLVFLFIPSIVLLTINMSGKIKYWILLFSLSILTILYSSNEYLQQSPRWMVNRIVYLRTLYMSVTNQSFSFNYDIPYPIAVLKATFTPYFTLNKFSLFYDFSYLLIWGSFINQIIIFTAIYCFFKIYKQSIIHIANVLPLIIFLLLLGYICPWNDRLRDSFYPIISIYSAYILINYRSYDVCINNLKCGIKNILFLRYRKHN